MKRTPTKASSSNDDPFLKSFDRSVIQQISTIPTKDLYTIPIEDFKTIPVNRFENNPNERFQTIPTKDLKTMCTTTSSSTRTGRINCWSILRLNNAFPPLTLQLLVFIPKTPTAVRINTVTKTVFYKQQIT